MYNVRNKCIIKCITNGQLIGIMLIQGDNSWRDEINHNQGDIRDNVCLKPLNGFYGTSLCVIIRTYGRLLKVSWKYVYAGK